jgi:hypothetical protein
MTLVEKLEFSKLGISSVFIISYFCKENEFRRGWGDKAHIHVEYFVDTGSNILKLIFYQISVF